MAKTNFLSVPEYIAHQPKQVQPALRTVRAILRKALPRATEGISYQIPVYKVDEQMVLYFAGYARHYAIYPATPRLIAALGKELSGSLRHQATIRFPIDAPVPKTLIARIAKLRAAEAEERARAKAAKPRKATKKASNRARPARNRKPSKRAAATPIKR
jgi:uncharacterized protein YdhG (YjbR/CyaY superfamily)